MRSAGRLLTPWPPPPHGAQPVWRAVALPGGRPFVWALLCVLRETLCSPVVAEIGFSVSSGTPSFASPGTAPVQTTGPIRSRSCWASVLPFGLRVCPGRPWQRVPVFIKVPYRQLGDSRPSVRFGEEPSYPSCVHTGSWRAPRDCQILLDTLFRAS